MEVPPRLPTTGRFTETVPWGNDSTGATFVRTNYSFDGTGGIVAVIDDGVNCSNPDLDSKVLVGWDFIGGDNSPCISGFSHGTYVSGVIAAELDAAGVVGMAPSGFVRVFRVCSYPSGPPSASCPSELIEDALHDIYDLRAIAHVDAVNISLGMCGGSADGDMQDAIEDLKNVNIPVVIGAGNCVGGSYFDSAGDHATLVTAHRVPASYVSPFSQDTEIDFAAPDSVAADSADGYRVGPFYGTSAAAPHAAASMIILREAGFPASTWVQRLESTLKSGGSYLGGGLLDVKAAAVPRPSVSYWSWCDGSSAIENYGDCTFTLTIANGVAPYQAKFIVWRSNVPNDSTIYDWGATTRDIWVANGDYTLTLKAWVREASPYLRQSAYHSIQEVPVCTEDALFAVCETGS
jgi:subtilisin family serine protease